MTVRELRNLLDTYDEDTVVVVADCGDWRERETVAGWAVDGADFEKAYFAPLRAVVNPESFVDGVLARRRIDTSARWRLTELGAYAERRGYSGEVMPCVIFTVSTPWSRIREERVEGA